MYSSNTFRNFCIFVWDSINASGKTEDKDIFPRLEQSILTFYDRQLYGRRPVSKESLSAIYPPLGTDEFLDEAGNQLLSLIMSGHKIIEDLSAWADLEVGAKEIVAEAAFAVASLVSSQGLLDSFCEREPDLATYLGTLYCKTDALANNTPVQEALPWRAAVDHLLKTVKTARNEHPDAGLARITACIEQLRLSAEAESDRIAEADGSKKSRALKRLLDPMVTLAGEFIWGNDLLAGATKGWEQWAEGSATDVVEKSVATMIDLVKIADQERLLVGKALEKARVDRAALDIPVFATIEERYNNLEDTRKADNAIADLSLRGLQVEERIRSFLTPPPAGQVVMPNSFAAPKQVKVPEVAPVAKQKVPSLAKVIEINHVQETLAEKVETYGLGEQEGALVEKSAKSLAVYIVERAKDPELPLLWASMSCALLAEGRAAAAYHAARVAGSLGFDASGEFALANLVTSQMVGKKNLLSPEFNESCMSAFCAGNHDFHNSEATGLLFLASCLTSALVHHDTESIAAMLSEITLPPRTEGLYSVVTGLKDFLRYRIPVDADILGEINDAENLRSAHSEAKNALRGILSSRDSLSTTYLPARNVQRAWLRYDSLMGLPLSAAIKGDYQLDDLRGFAEQMGEKNYVEICIKRTDNVLRSDKAKKTRCCHIDFGAKKDLVDFANMVSMAVLRFLDADQALKSLDSSFYIEQIKAARKSLNDASIPAAAELSAIITSDAPFETRAAAQTCLASLKRMPAVFENAPEEKQTLASGFLWKEHGLEIAIDTEVEKIPALLAQAIKSNSGAWKKNPVTAPQKTQRAA